MPSKDLATSTGKLVAFLGGVSPSDFMLRWGHKQSNLETGTWEALLSEKLEGDETITIGPFYVQGTTTRIEAPLTIVIRSVCHRLLDRIPDQGLPELCESLGRIRAFYSAQKEQTVRLLPAPTQQISAKLGKTYQRPEFPVIPE